MYIFGNSKVFETKTLKEDIPFSNLYPELIEYVNKFLNYFTLTYIDNPK